MNFYKYLEYFYKYLNCEKTNKKYNIVKSI